jgi:hypothetical protein
MKVVFIIAAVLTVLLLAASTMYWVLHASTGEDVARQRAVGFFRWAVVVVLGTFNIWIFGRVGGAIIEIWFPEMIYKPPVVVVPVEEGEAESPAASQPEK